MVCDALVQFSTSVYKAVMSGAITKLRFLPDMFLSNMIFESSTNGENTECKTVNLVHLTLEFKTFCF